MRVAAALGFLMLVTAGAVWAQAGSDEEELGHQAFAAGKYQAATQHYQKSRATGRARLRSELNLVRAYLYQGRIEEARMLMTELRDTASEDSEFWLLQGDLSRQQSDWEAARECYETALEMDSQNALAYLSLGQALSQLGDHVGADEAFGEYARLNPQ
jgi:tetratricopeptide (TPR) repeat protein